MGIDHITYELLEDMSDIQQCKDIVTKLRFLVKRRNILNRSLGMRGDSFTIRILNEAIARLEDYMPRVMTLEEVLENAGKIGLPCWVEDHIEDIGDAVLFPAVITSDDTYVQYSGNDYYEGAIYHWAYNKRLRCWTSRPDEKRRADTPWND